MRVDIDIKNNKCRFEQCRHFSDGECLSDEARKDCIDIALAVLCLDKEVDNEG